MIDAFVDGVANGLREHVPGAVGIIVKGVAACASLALVHVVLAIPVASTAIGATGVGATSYLLRAGLERKLVQSTKAKSDLAERSNAPVC